MATPRPELAFGERFKVRSHAGKLHVLTFLHWPDGAESVYVRLNNNEIARLNDDRVEWASCRPSSGTLKPPMVPGDAIYLDTAEGSSQGWLIQLGKEILYRCAEGGATRVHVDDLLGLFLLFRARSLKHGDLFLAQTKTGTHLRGQVKDVSALGVASVELHDGSQVQLALATLASDSLQVMVPIPVRDLIDTRSGDLEIGTARIAAGEVAEGAAEAANTFLLCCNPLDPIEFELGTPVIVGRSPRLANLVLPNKGVSRKHAEFLQRSDGLYVRDLGSVNGTWIDADRVGNRFVKIPPTATVRIEVFHLSIQEA